MTRKTSRKNPGPVTMRNIARQAGCSVMSVSLALRNSSEVGKELRERVCRIALETGYRPNPLVSALVSSRRKLSPQVLAVISKFETPIGSWSKPRAFYSDLFNGIVERADELGFLIEEFPVGGERNPTGEQLTRVFRARGIRGVILFPGGDFERSYPECDWQHFVVVAAGFHASGKIPVHRTSTDYMIGMDACLAELTRRGYRRIGLALTRALDANIGYSISGRYLAWREQQPRAMRIPVIESWDARPSQETVSRWFTAHRPDCVLTTDQRVCGWLRELGLKIPGDVGVAAVPVRHSTTLAGMDARTREVGRITIDLLARELYLNHAGLPAVPEVASVAGAWREGISVRPNAPADE